MLFLLLAFAAHASWITERQVAPYEPEERAAIEIRAAAFDWDAFRGNLQVTEIRAEYLLRDGFAVGAQLPIARIGFANGGLAYGPGDAVITGRAGFAPTQKIVLGGGLGLGLPTGSASLGLGSGHLEIRPFVGGAVTIKDGQCITLHVEDVLSASARADDAGALHGSMLDPHTPHELRVEAAWVRAGQKGWWLAGLAPRIPIAEPTDPGVVAFTVAGGWNVADGWLITGNYEQPFMGRPRFRWQVGLGLQVSEPRKRFTPKPKEERETPREPPAPSP